MEGLRSDFSSKFKSSMTICYHKLFTREGRVLANGGTHPSSRKIFVHLFITSVIQEVALVTINTVSYDIIYIYISYLKCSWHMQTLTTRFHLHLSGFVLKLWWAAGLHGNSTLACRSEASRLILQFVCRVGR